MSATYLDSIVEFHRARAAADSRNWRERHEPRRQGPSLAAAARAHRSQGLGVIAEVKRRSPSLGWINEDLDAVMTAKLYADGGALGVSVLTDEAHFGGSLHDLGEVATAIDLPVLRKDFTVSENDVLDAAHYGAAAILLIVAALDHDELVRFMALASEQGIDALVEVHDEGEIAKALDLGATFIGINQRDLHTFKVDTARAERLVSLLPSTVVAVAESGFRDQNAAARAAEVGFDAILVGEHVVTSEDPAAAVRSFGGFAIGERS